ncbi:MAG: bifunctional metallophosphatase/5'-nucleotidase [Vampirovibrionales bacterium]
MVAMQQSYRVMLGLLWVLGLSVGLPLLSDAEEEALPQFQCQPHQTCLTFALLNDVYQLFPYPANAEGSYSRAASILKEIRSADRETAFLFAGDTLSPSVESQMTQGKHMVDALNVLKPLAATLGNHEFDFGPAVLKTRLNDSLFPWLAANIKPLDKAVQANIWPYVVRPIKGQRVLIYGLLTKETLVASKVDGAYDIDDPITYALADLPKVIAQEQPDVVILLTHVTIAEDRALAQRLRHAGVPVHAIFGGHDHHQLFQVVAGVPIIKLDSDARTLGRFQLNVLPATHSSASPKKRLNALFSKQHPSTLPSVATVEEFHYKVYPVSPSIPVDTTFQEALNVSVGSLYAGLDKPLGKTGVALDVHSSVVRSNEAVAGNFIADALRQQFNTQVSLVNGGALRAEHTFPAGMLTQRDILMMMPFANKVTLIHGTGALLKEVLEWSVSRRAEDAAWGGFLQVSGLNVTYDLSQPVGKRVTRLVWAGSQQPIRATEAVFFNIPNYLAEGGNAYAMLPAYAKGYPESVSVTVFTDADAVGRYLQQQATPVLPKLEQRIQLINNKKES